MTSRDTKAWRELFGVLCATYDRIFDEAQSQFYYTALKDCDLADVKACALEMVQTSKWFPKPAEWRQAIGVRRFNARRERERELAGRSLAATVQCEHCGDTGMKLVQTEPDERYAHCECRTSNVNYLIQSARTRMADEGDTDAGTSAGEAQRITQQLGVNVRDFKRLQSGGD